MRNSLNVRYQFFCVQVTFKYTIEALVNLRITYLNYLSSLVNHLIWWFVHYWHILWSGCNKNLLNDKCLLLGYLFWKKVRPTTVWALFSSFFFLQNGVYNTFVCIWQILSNHELNSLKCSSRKLHTNCAINYFWSIFNAPYICRKIRCNKKFKKNCKSFWKLNKALVGTTRTKSTLAKIYGLDGRKCSQLLIISHRP